MSDDFFGKSKDGGSFVKKNWWKLKDGSATYRILPALGGNAESGTWSVFWNVHYGYKNSKGELRTFQSSEVKNHKTKMIEAPDAAKTKIEKLKAQLDAAKKAVPQNPEVIARLDKLVGQKGQYNIDSNHYVNAMDAAGNIGILKIRHRCMVALKAELKLLEAKGIDPRDPANGRFLVFTRSGMGLDTTFKITVLQETVDVPNFGPMNRDKVSTLTADIPARCAKKINGKWVYLEAGDLPNLYKRPTSEQVARIVAEGAPAVDEILNNASDSSAAGTSDDAGHDDSGDYDSTPQAAPAAQATQGAPAPATAAVQTSNPPSTPAPQAAAPAAQPAFAQPAPAALVAQATQTASPAVTETSEAEFLKSLGL